jgi:hypothetical protein
MPGHGYGLPAPECKTGSKLRQVEGSTCSGCYAMKGRYMFPNVQAALYRRLELIGAPAWPEAMAESIERTGDSHFRWHDSGDLQSVDHLRAIVRVAELTPAVAHWLPTREYRIVSDYLQADGTFPPNLTVRMSAHMIGGKLPTFKGMPVTISTVSRDESTYPDAHQCPARHQGNECGSCRACWDANVPQVDYHLH